MSKRYISAQELLIDSYKLAVMIYDSGFRPDFIVGVWRGGSPIGIAVQEMLDYLGMPSDHIAIRTSSYTAIGEQSNLIKVHGLHYIIEEVNAEDSLLIIDDVFDSGRSIDAALTELKFKTRNNMPKQIKIACPWYKPENSKVELVPDYYLHETSEWLVFPHELKDLTKSEIREGKPGVIEIIGDRLNQLD